MKNPCKALLAFLFLALPLAAQEGDGFGFLNIVNLIPGDSPADVTIAGKILSPDGLLAGSDTGWFMVPIGKKSMTIDLEQPEETKVRIEKASGEIELLEGLANVVAIYLQPDKRVKPDGTPFPPKIRIRSFPAYDGKGFALRLVSTCPADNRFQIGPRTFDAKPFDTVEIPGWSGAPFDILRNGKVIGKAAGSSEKGSFYVFVGHDGKDGYVTATTRAGTQQVPPWMKKDKKETTSPDP